jgi:hypothetical protein
MMLLKRPPSFIIFLVVICLTLSCFAVPVFLIPIAFLLAIAGFFTGMVYTYKEGTSKLLNRIGWIGNLVVVIAVMVVFFYIVRGLE